MFGNRWLRRAKFYSSLCKVLFVLYKFTGWLHIQVNSGLEWAIDETEMSLVYYRTMEMIEDD